MPHTPNASARRAAAAALFLAAGAAACGGGAGPTAPAPGPRLEVREMILVGDNGDTIYSHNDHWHGFPVVGVDRRVRYAKHFVAASRSADDHDMPARNEWFTLAAHPGVGLTSTVETPSVAAWEGDHVAGTLIGRRAGASRVTFVVRRGTTTLKEVPALPFTVR